MNKNFTTLLVKIFCSISLIANPNFWGSTGLIFMPTADALRYKEANFAFDYILTQDQKTNDYKYKLNMGIYENLELGFAGGKYPDEGVFVNLKYYLMSTEERFPLKIALGTENLSSEIKTSAYMVASKRFNPELAGHFGFNVTFGTQTKPGVMAGLAFYITEILELITDVTGNEKKYFWNIGAKVKYSQYGTFSTSLIDIGNIKDPKLAIGFSQQNFL